MAVSLRDRTTSLLCRLEAGEQGLTVDQLVPFVYEELRRMASRQLARERGLRSLGTTGVVHEAYLRLVDQSRVAERGRAYFFAAASQAMRRVLVDAARRRNAARRGGGERPVTLEPHHATVDGFAAELAELDDALERLAAESPRLASVVEARYFGGLTNAETAAALDVSERTVKYDWAMARAWLRRALGAEGDDGGGDPG